MVSSRGSFSSPLMHLAVVVVLAAVVAAGRLERRDGSTITVSTTQFNPAITNQGGTTNAAGTFNVSPLATSTSYQFQSLSQTSTFVIGPVNTQAPSNNGGSGGSSGGGNGGSGGSGGNGGNVGGGTVVVTATAPTSTVSMGGSGTGSSSSGTGSAASSGPSLALGATNGVARVASSNPAMLATSAAMVLLATVYGAFIIA